MPSCVINFCKNNSLAQNKSAGITFHKFPKELEWKKKWIDAIRLSRNDETWLPSKFSVVCSTHFVEKDLYITKNGLRRVIKNAVPKKMGAWRVPHALTSPPVGRVTDRPTPRETEDAGGTVSPPAVEEASRGPRLPGLRRGQLQEMGVNTPPMAIIICSSAFVAPLVLQISIGDGNRFPSSGPSACLLSSCNIKKKKKKKKKQRDS
ncbi:hypothetical protein K1T71_009975 [Dendrolimus kikuchii]|uniref:Uncharacterized protein n=1 Tax=Dendrolimus kikuchii TaxID=765133 RepID=A0ACC1CUD8_9NEOP|nr:hypothetical protein K1T71_009975 [Dendrolimus kikuchii]